MNNLHQCIFRNKKKYSSILIGGLLAAKRGRIINALFALLLALTCAACYRPGGGGTVHVPPTQAIEGQPLTVELTTSVWGAGDEELQKRWTNVRCIYRGSQSTEWTSLDMTAARSDDKHLTFHANIPAQLPGTDAIEYYFTYTFDGYAKTRGTAQSPVRVKIGGPQS